MRAFFLGGGTFFFFLRFISLKKDCFLLASWLFFIQFLEFSGFALWERQRVWSLCFVISQVLS